MISAASTDVGRIRKQNEDSYRLRIISDQIAYGIVCDGMGGANGGQVASKTAADMLAERFDSFFENQKPPYDITTLLRRSIREVNDKLYRMSRLDESLAGMGTTLVMAIVVKNELFVANVGDSRAYLTTHNSISQISVDHSAVQELVDIGKITKEEAKNHPQKNIITRALGVDSMVEFDFYTYNFSPGSCVLLCSDGLSNYCNEDTLLDILNQNDSVVSITERLVTYANQKGGSDNITALLIKQD